MTLNKIQLKALVFKLIEPVRKLSAIDDITINSILFELKHIKDADFEFISKLLIKEADENNQKVSTAILYIAENIAPDSFIGFIMNELNSNVVSDGKKMFLINILSGFGIQMDPEYVNTLLSNPIQAINSETLKFLENAQTDPEALIDFLDFYFIASDEDKKELLHSIVQEADADKLSYILSPLVLSLDESDTILYYLDILNEEKSLNNIKALNYISFYNNQKISKKASRTLRKMFMQGFYTEEKVLDFYKNNMKKYDYPTVRISMPDGNSNFSIVISRKTKNNAYYVVFIAVNINLGPFSVFGFSSITEFDYKTVVKRFFSEGSEIFIDASYAKKILTELVIKRIKQNKTVPYEYFCWEKLLDDIKPAEKKLDELLSDGLKTINLNEMENKVIYNSPYTENWFFKCSKINSPFCELINKISLLNSDNLLNIEDLICEYSSNEEIVNTLKDRLIFLAFCLKQEGADDFANIFYSLIYKNEMKNFTENILKRSIYEYMLSLKFPKKKNYGLFKKTGEKENIDAQIFLNYIEKKWVK